MRKVLATLVVLLVVGCASYQPVPDGYSGPTAEVYDTSVLEDRTKAQIFALVAVEGNPVENALGASRRASYGQGLDLTAKTISRRVPARPMKVTIRGSHVTGAPIHAILSSIAGTYFSVEGTVDFMPQPNKTYFVRGELSQQGSSVWIEDFETKRPVTEKVLRK